MSPNDFMFNLVVQPRSKRFVQQPRQQLIRRVYVKPPIIEKEEIIFVIGGDKDLELKQNQIELNKMMKEEEASKINSEEKAEEDEVENLIMNLSNDFELEEVYDEKQISPGNNTMNE
jgi:hypothetical protein